MNLAELIYSRFVGSDNLTKNLAKYQSVPAIFSSDPPNDDQEGWGGKPHYPMIVYNFDMQANQERNSAGTLSVSVLCANEETAVYPEDLESIIRERLRDVIMKPEKGAPYCFAWARTDAFTVEEKKTEITVGSEIRFDILEYPSQETSDPDPIMAANKYLKEKFPECLVMGYDRMEEITEATKERPVLYCRLLSTDKQEETNTVAWMDGRIAVHVLCPENEVRMKVAANIAQNLSLDGEIIMLDYSPMFIKRLQVNYKSDYLKDGQIFVTGHYGLLRYKPKSHSLLATNVNYE